MKQVFKILLFAFAAIGCVAIVAASFRTFTGNGTFIENVKEIFSFR